MQAASLRQKKSVAAGLLAAAFALFLLGITMAHQSPHWGWRALVAFSEAALVGGLADWFAVEVLFRHPMGIKLPHTAIIPNKKERLGNALADFVRDHFLSHAQLLDRLQAFNPAQQLADGLRSPRAAAWVAGLVATQIPPLLENPKHTAFWQRVYALLQEKGKQVDLSNLTARLLDFLLHDTRRQQDALNALLRAIADELRKPELHDALQERVSNELGGFIRSLRIDRFIAEPVAEKIADGALHQIDDILLQPEHPVRHRVLAYLQTLTQQLKEDPQLRAELDQARDELLQSTQVAAYLDEVGDALRQWVLTDLNTSHSHISERIRRGVTGLGRYLADDAALQARINAWCIRTAEPLISEYREAARNYIAERVQQWSAQDMADTIEQGIAADLQYIRYNGTVIGGVIGLLLFACMNGIQWLMG